jgi:FeS assembly SUF system regulator
MRWGFMTIKILHIPPVLLLENIDIFSPTAYYQYATNLVVFDGMLKLTKKADYGLIAMKHLAVHGDEGISFSSSDIAQVYGIPAPLMAKILQKLARGGLVAARHGSLGGYILARDPARISALDVISAIDGPVSITSCVTSHGECNQSATCNVREPLRVVNSSILDVLSRVTLSQMAGKPSVVELRV